MMTTMDGEGAIRVGKARIALESVPIGKLNVDYSYQRPLRQRTVAKYAREFDFEKFGTPYVSEREDGSLWVIDGQHRIRAAAQALDLDDSQRIPAVVYRGLSVKEEAGLWTAYNRDRTAPRAVDNHQAAVVAGDPEAIAVERALEKRMLVAAEGPGPGKVKAIKVAYELHRHGVLGAALDSALTAWGSDQAALNGPMLKALGLLLGRYGKRADTKRLAQRLASTTPDVLMAKARAAQAADPDSAGKGTSGTTLVDYVARVVISTYNYRLTSTNKLARWEPRTARNYWAPMGK